MLTLGIDLASDPKNTAACVVEWTDGHAVLRDPVCPLDDDGAVELIKSADKVGIDAPFGWPDDFVHALNDHHAGRLWPTTGDAARSRMRLRETDREVHKRNGRNPLSVSTDRISIAAMRCAEIFAKLPVSVPVDRTGIDGKLCEVYPAGALAAWGITASRYKGADGRALRALLVGKLAREMPWLEIPDGVRTKLEATDHAFDALISALVARAVALQADFTHPIPSDQRDRARREGWIHLPFPESVARFAKPPPR